MRAVMLDARSGISKGCEIACNRAPRYSERVHEFGKLVNTRLRAKGFENPDAARDRRACKRRVLAIGSERDHAAPFLA